MYSLAVKCRFINGSFTIFVISTSDSAVPIEPYLVPAEHTEVTWLLWYIGSLFSLQDKFNRILGYHQTAHN